jgi:hypothetical protein
MGIRFVNKVVTRGLISTRLDDASAMLVGTNGSPASRSGVITTQLGNAVASLSGVFTHSPNRTGSVIATLDPATGAFIASATAPGGSLPAPSNVRLVQQGGTNNSTSPSTSSQKHTWNAVPGAAGYKIYRSKNGGPYDVSFDVGNALTHTDTTCTNSNDPNYRAFLDLYRYKVVAYDSHGAEGAPGFPSFYFIENGVAKQNKQDLSYGIPPASENWNGTLGGRACAIFNFAGGGFQPVSGPPLAPQWDAVISDGFSKYTVDIYFDSPTLLDTGLQLGCARRIPDAIGGDAFGWRGDVPIFNGSFGTPIPRTWQTWQFDKQLIGFGTGNITATITGSTLTVTAYNGPNVLGAGGRISGPGVPANTVVRSHNQSNTIGTFTLYGPGIPVTGTVVLSNLSGLYQMANAYKPSFNHPNNSTPWTMGFDNVGFIP